MASARIREQMRAKQAAARRSGVSKRPRRTLDRKQLQLPTSPRTRANRRAQRGPVDHSPASRPKHVKTQSLVNIMAASQPAMASVHVSHVTADAGTFHPNPPQVEMAFRDYQMVEVFKPQHKGGSIWQMPLHAGASVHSWIGGAVTALRARFGR